MRYRGQRSFTSAAEADPAFLSITGLKACSTPSGPTLSSDRARRPAKTIAADLSRPTAVLFMEAQSKPESLLERLLDAAGSCFEELSKPVAERGAELDVIGNSRGEAGDCSG